ncbi:hypothetical protein [Methanococcoides methylutens]|uniref:Uncharacterized protein n=1 Tax=Methanococcoides methylutens MM1 TaxID=1434104 RepID=A0A0E3SRB0_METMT|nr:hypothetical protein [Methanococcoides methylutens]AKB85411.1 hypothetical protein MCMEM_1358 [Methanococcoides methylutens MM1]
MSREEILNILGYLRSERIDGYYYKRINRKVTIGINLDSSYGKIINVYPDNDFKEVLDYPHFTILRTGDWEVNRSVIDEFKKLHYAGVIGGEVRKSDKELIAMLIEDGYYDININGFCNWCNKDIQKYDKFCSEDCKLNYDLQHGFKIRCSVCNNPIKKEDIVKHHTSYKKDITIDVCRICHAKIHHSNVPNFTIYQPDDDRPHTKPKYKLIRCDGCGGQLRLNLEAPNYVIDCSGKILNLCSKCKTKMSRWKEVDIKAFKK